MAAEQEYGRVTQSKGNVAIIRKDGTVEKARAGAVIHEGDQLRTGDNAKAEVSYPDGDVSRFGSLTDVRFTREKTQERPSATTITG